MQAAYRKKLIYFQELQEEDPHCTTKTTGNLGNGFLYPIQSGKNINHLKSPSNNSVCIQRAVCSICIHKATLILLLNIWLRATAGENSYNTGTRPGEESAGEGPFGEGTTDYKMGLNNSKKLLSSKTGK